MNELKALDVKPLHTEFYKFGMSTLHCKIRFMESLLHVAYHMPFKKNACKKENAPEKKGRKTQIQKELKSQLGILVDVVKQGYDTTNTGNTARRFFNPKNHATVAKILGINKKLIARFSVILGVISADRKVKIDRFKKYCRETAELWVKLYSWKNMTPTVHKVLIHGWAIIENLGFNIGRYSEEAQEAINKIFREARAKKSRGISAIACNTDVHLHLLVGSDVRISTLRLQLTPSEKKKIKHSKEAQKMLEKK